MEYVEKRVLILSVQDGNDLKIEGCVFNISRAQDKPTEINGPKLALSVNFYGSTLSRTSISYSPMNGSN